MEIKCEGPGAGNLSRLLRKRPGRAHCFNLGFGKARVFFPTSGPEASEACLLLQEEPAELKKPGTGRFCLDEPQFFSPELMSAAIARVYGSALRGAPQAWANEPLALKASVSAFPWRLPFPWLKKIFAPLGYNTAFHGAFFGDTLGGISGRAGLSLSARLPLKSLLEHLYVLLPLFSAARRMRMNEERAAKFIRHAKGWLATHPEADFIITNYFMGAPGLARRVMERLGISGALPINWDFGEDLSARVVLEEVRASGGSSFIDLCCGDGSLLAELAHMKRLKKIAGADASARELKKARKRLERIASGRCELFLSSPAYRDSRLCGYEIAALRGMNLEPGRRELVMENIFESASPNVLIITSSGGDYKAFGAEAGPEGGGRAPAMGRDEFCEWAARAADKFGCKFKLVETGGNGGGREAPVLAGVFKKCV